MSIKDTRAALLGAFRETTLSLIGLFELYEAEPDLTEATAEALGHVLRSYLKRSGQGAEERSSRPLHVLLDEIDAATAEAA